MARLDRMSSEDREHLPKLPCPAFEKTPWVPSKPLNSLRLAIVSTNFDRTGFQNDWNVVFPLDRLRELVEEGVLGSLAEYHYSFMGATDPVQMEHTARGLAGIMKNEGVDGVLLAPV